MAEAIGERRPRGVQHLLNDARWDPHAVRDDLREYVVEHLGDEQSGVLVVDETGFLKKGNKSIGVARQYTGTAGKRGELPGGGFPLLCLQRGCGVHRSGFVPARGVDRRSAAGLSEAGVPEGVGFSTKGELAREMLKRAFEAGVPARWVVADTVYGMTRGLRGWLEERQRSYVLAVTSSKSVYHEGHQRRVRRIMLETCPEESWIRASAGKGTKGERLYDWACVELPESGMYREGVRAGRWLLMRRSIAEPEKIAYYLCYGPAQTTVEELIRIAGRRWVIEDCFEAAKGEVGLDEYEVRKWDGWHRHVTLCLLAHAYLAVVRSVAAQEEDFVKRGISSRIPTPN